MAESKEVAVCKYCKQPITHYSGRLWHDAKPIFPQYCTTGRIVVSRAKRYADGGQLHVPDYGFFSYSDPKNVGRG